jgi:hypothetical protein
VKAVQRLSKGESYGYKQTSKFLVILDAKNSTGYFTIIRPRTPTSPGMKNGVLSNKDLAKEAGKNITGGHSYSTRQLEAIALFSVELAILCTTI